SILTYLPARQDQESVIRALKTGSAGPFNLARIEKTFESALRENGFREGIYDNYLKTLPATLNPPRPVTLKDLEAAGLAPFVSRYVKMGDLRPRTVTCLFAADVAAKRHAPAAPGRAVNDPDEGVENPRVDIASTELRRLS